MRKNFIILILVALVPFFMWAGVYVPKNSSSNDQIEFVVKKGEGAEEISNNLAERGIIRGGIFFRSYVYLKEMSGSLKAGKYSLSPSMNIPEIAEKMVEGDVIKKTFTVIEGWNLRNVAQRLEELKIVEKDEVFNYLGVPALDYSENPDLTKPKDFSDKFSFLSSKPENISLEGFLFPDTYEISEGEGLEEIIIKIFSNFDKKTEDIRGDFGEDEFFDILTMASIIEKEVRTKEDKGIVSGILWKRISLGMPLQVDATLSYILDKKSTKISIEETKVDSPYNAYKYRGLPLGPISNPGIESIEAAAFPTESSYLYYLSTPEGETIFSRTLQEHNAAKAKYLK